MLVLQTSHLHTRVGWSVRLRHDMVDHLLGPLLNTMVAILALWVYEVIDQSNN